MSAPQLTPNELAAFSDDDRTIIICRRTAFEIKRSANAGWFLRKLATHKSGNPLTLRGLWFAISPLEYDKILKLA